jgi:hypothetical protein
VSSGLDELNQLELVNEGFDSSVCVCVFVTDFALEIERRFQITSKSGNFGGSWSGGGMSETLPSSSSLSELDARSGLLSAMLVLSFFPFWVLTGKSSLLKNWAGGLDLVFIRSWISPIYSSFQNDNVEKFSYIFSLCAKVRENRSLRKLWLKLKYSIPQFLLPPIMIFPVIDYFALWEIPQDVSQREGTKSLQNKLADKALKSNPQVESSARNKNFSKRRTSGKDRLNIYLDFKLRYENSNDIERSNTSM